MQRHTQDWSAIVEAAEAAEAADAAVIVISEYNYGYPGPLKNAIDHLHEECKHQPAGFVSSGGVAGGMRPEFIDEEDRVQVTEVMEQAAEPRLDELVRTEAAPRTLRPVATHVR